MNLNEMIGARVKEERGRRGWSQFALLKRAGFPVQPGNLSRLEKGKTVWSATLIESIAQAFGIEPADLTRQPPKHSDPPPAANQAA